MSNPAANEYLARILGEAKLLEKKLEKEAERRKALEDRIRVALKAGDRPAAEKMALELERAKDGCARLEREIKSTRDQYEQAKQRVKQVGHDVRAAKTLGATAQALEGLNKAMGLAKDTEEMVRKLEEDAAVAEARLDIAGQNAEEHARRVEPVDSEAMKKLTAEQILRELEGK